MISIVCAAKNRSNALRVSLASWLVSSGVDEIVVVDWDSDEPLSPMASLDPRVRVVRVDNEPRFHLSAAFNLAADLAAGDTLLKLDADYVLNPFYDFIRWVSLPADSFVTGHFQHGGPFLAYLHGLVYVRKEHWQRIHGYNENLTNYGWDDDDFYLRLVQSGLQRAILNPPPIFAFHIPHNDTFRSQNYDIKDLVASHQQNQQAASIPYLRRRYSWKVSPIGLQVFSAEKQILD